MNYIKLQNSTEKYYDLQKSLKDIDIVMVIKTILCKNNINFSYCYCLIITIPKLI